MSTDQKTKIKVATEIAAPLRKVWDCYTQPAHVTGWNFASEDWFCPRAENNLVEDGKFSYRMESRDGEHGFDFSGVYTEVEPLKNISYRMDDGRISTTRFSEKDGKTTVNTEFDAEGSNPEEMQRAGWQAILDNFKSYTENNRFEKLNFEIMINAPVEKVYKTMLAPDTYAQWTKEFNESSHYKGNWEKGSKILFIGSDKDGNLGGMVSRIRENIPNKFVSIEHNGLLQGGQEITIGPEVEGWAGSQENYTFREENGSTFVSVELDSNEEFASYFSETWPKALRKLKEIAEAN